MSSLGSPNSFFLAGKKAYEVDRSLRFNRSDSAHLTYTPGSASSDRTKVTISAWVKKCKNNEGEYSIFFGGTSSTNRAQLRFYTSSGFDNISFYARTSGTFILQLDTTAKFRDPSAWYHIVARCDTTNGTANIYVNGVEETSFTTSTKPSGSQSMEFFNNSEHQIGENGSSTSGTYMNGYMAEINVIQGQALDASYFGETDAITGQWNPKKYVGGYGDGFYLNFSDNSGTTATTLGKDSSGNGNNFTPNNFSTHDSVPDSPTNNFCTGNPIGRTYTNEVGNNPTYSEGNLEFETAGNSTHAYGTMAVNEFLTSGCYFEILLDDLDTSRSYVGIVDSQSSGNSASYGFTNKAIIRHSMVVYFGTATDGSGNYDSGVADCSNGDIIGVAIKGTSIWFHKNGTYIPNSSGSTGNPSTGANAAITSISNITTTKYLPYAGYNSDYTFNFGQDSSFAGAKTAQGNVDGKGKGDFYYPVPTGFVALCSANMSDPTIKLPNKHFDTLLWTGNGSDGHAITGLDFQPNWVWIKSRSVAVSHFIVDSLRMSGSDFLKISSVSTSAESDGSTRFTSIDSNGFTLPSGGTFTNGNGSTYVGWNWNAGDTDGKTYTVTVVSDSGNKYRFDGFGTSAVTLDLAEGGTYIFNYPSAHPLKFSTTSDGTHGGGSEYTTGVTHNSSTQVTIVVAASAPQLFYYCSIHSGMGGSVNTNSTLGSSNFDGSIQTTAKVNATAGFSITTYTGTGSSTTVGHGLGVKPDVIIIKCRSNTDNWMVYHNQKNGGVDPEDYYLELNSTSAGPNSTVMLNDTAPTSTSVTIGSDNSVNGSSRTYVMYCFSEVAGYSKFGKYTGNGNNDGTFVFTGFKVQFLLIKKTSGSESWILADTKRNSIAGRESPADSYLLADQSNAESTGIIYDMLSNGFKFRSTSQNTSGHTYVYFAFAEAPFKNARAR